jgi:hypothetical protein
MAAAVIAIKKRRNDKLTASQRSNIALDDVVEAEQQDNLALDEAVAAPAAEAELQPYRDGTLCVEDPQLEEALIGSRKKCRLPHQTAVRELYTNNTAQWVIAAIILANFAVTVIDRQIDPRSTLYDAEFHSIYDVFNVLFLLECLTNLYAHGWRFWRSGWNLFDAAVVCVGIVYVLNITFPGYSALRVLRAFRVFRLFKRVPSLHRIIVALGAAVPGVSSAFVILILVVCIYAIIAVEFFAAQGDGSVMDFSGFGNFSVGNTQNMGLDGLPYWFGEQYFGDFATALFTMFQILTGDSWGEIARPLLFATGGAAFGVSLFFVSFIVLTTIVLLNVVVAVLLEKIVDEVPGVGHRAGGDRQLELPGAQPSQQQQTVYPHAGDRRTKRRSNAAGAYKEAFVHADAVTDIERRMETLTAEVSALHQHATESSRKLDLVLRALERNTHTLGER